MVAARRARRGKRFKPNVLLFEDRREEELRLLQKELRSGTYRPGPYRTFVIYEPRRRLISAAPYRDRVVHHALCQVIEPHFERSFLSSSCANRVGFGTHRALRRFTRLLRRHKWVLRGDIRKFFPSLDHEILKQRFATRIRCRPTLELMGRIVDHSNEQEPVEPVYLPGEDLFSAAERRRGLPIGNLTSQFFANVFLDPLDHFVVETLRVGPYVRYVDDFAVFANSREELEECRRRIQEFLLGFRLRLHPIKTQIHRTRIGASFVGFQVLPDRVRIRSENLRRARRRLRQYRRLFATGGLSAQEVGHRVRSWVAHLEHGDTYRLREQLFSAFTLVRG